MTNINNAELKQVIVHKLGNPSRQEALELSKKAISLDDEIIKGLLTKYFLSPFDENDQFHFTHINDIELNEMYSYVSAIFSNPKSLTEQSALMAQFLYSKSNHPKIKEGELYVAYFEEVLFHNEMLEAVGIFKSETKETFLKVSPGQDNWNVSAEDGININKLDKGCIVFKEKKHEGYVLCVVDNTNKQNETQYWVNDFLQVTRYDDNYHRTNDVLGMCKLFIDNEMSEKFETSKSDKIDMMNRSMEYFKTKDHFDMEDFATEVIHHEEVIGAFNDYRQRYENSKNVELADNFDIHLSAVKKQERFFKAVLKLDKNFHVYVHGRRDMIEKGVDDQNGRKYYKLYYENES